MVVKKAQISNGLEVCWLTNNFDEVRLVNLNYQINRGSMLVIWTNGKTERDVNAIKQIAVYLEQGTPEDIQAIADFIKLALPESHIVLRTSCTAQWADKDESTSVIEWVHHALMGEQFNDEEAAVEMLRAMPSYLVAVLDSVGLYDVSEFIKRARK